MISLRARFTRTAVTLGGLAATTLLVAGTAHADMLESIDPLLNTNCSFEQVQNTMRAEYAPLADQLDADQQQGGTKWNNMRDILSVAPDQRQAKVNERRAEVEQNVPQTDPQVVAAAKEIFQTIADHCSTH
ncbi:hypothetical protein [Nocardia sp. NPDC051570]|uniref:hypothetical protein n=1 Tax=Nocardia sp. NPDC051570 TaxID=3364324 RepID=UPI0037966590